MLSFLQIRNFAIIESLELEFASGFTAITGETGAGKSILVDALGLLKGRLEQARVAAANMCGGDKTYASIPWFWSDQYELKLQMVGFSADGDQQVLRGDKAANKFAVFYLNNGAVVAADAVNSPKEFMICKQLIGRTVDQEALADPETDLKGLLA